VRSMLLMTLSGALFWIFLGMEAGASKRGVGYDPNVSKTTLRSKPKKIIGAKEEDPYFQLLTSLDPDHRCRDDRPEHPSAASFSTTSTPCTCTDPTVPIAGTRRRWMDFHQTLVDQATSTSTTNLDVLFLGDSIMERWRGSMFAGKTAAPAYAQVFRQYFSKPQGESGTNHNTLQGAAFGGSGDTSVELLYHVQNGVLQDHVQPRAIVVLIGTNDVGRVGCSPRHTLVGILHVARYLQQQRPHAQLILHGMLPRNEEYGDGNFTVGLKWQHLQWINTQLQHYCATTKRRGAANAWHYIENGNMFFTDDNNEKTTINATLMEDALHPSLEGYRLWGARLLTQIQDILNDSGG